MLVRGHLHFSQSSQPTASQNLSNALEKCQLASQEPMVVSQEPDLSQQDSAYPSQQQMPESCTQDGFLCTPDFATPQDQQYDIQVDPADSAAVHMRSPAALSPNRIKRPRNTGLQSGILGDSVEDNCSQLSQSQPSQLDRGTAVWTLQQYSCSTATRSYSGDAGTTVSGHSHGMFPVPQARKMLRKRYHSPPALRNVFLHGPDDVGPTLPKAPLPASRYRAEFKEIRLLGCGNFSKVCLAQHRLDGINYAVKRSAHKVLSDAVKRQWVQEVHALAAVGSHPHIVRYHTAWIEKDAAADGEHLYIQLEACDTSVGNLRALKNQAKEADLVEMLRQIALALQHMHSKNMVHMDIKPDNIYIVNEVTYKLGDLGLAASSSAHQRGNFEEGDARYIPAEVLNGDLSELPKADMFMLGITLYELAMCMDLPSGGSTYQSLRRGKLMLMPTFSSSFQHMLASLMSAKPSERPSADQVLASPLFVKKSAQKDAKPQHAFGRLNLQPSRASQG